MPLAILAVLAAAGTLWMDQQSARARIAEAELQPVRARADAAEARAVRAEVDYLRQTGRHLGGDSTFNVDASPPTQQGPDRSSIHTHERWLYDERDQADRRQRCFVEDSDQTYTLVRSNEDWLVDEVELAGSSRVDC